MTDQRDFFVIVKKNHLRRPWSWEIYRSGRKSAVERSEVHFATFTEANWAGRKALSSFLSEFQVD